MPTRVPVVLTVAAVVCAAPFAAGVRAQDSKSAAPVKQLVQLLQEKKLDAVAAQHQGASDMFVAALYFPGQMLVVSARYAAPALLTEKITKGDYRDVYIDLNSASIAASKVLINDLGADGLRARRDENQLFDQQDSGSRSIRFNGDWREQKISEQEYLKTFAEADRAYAAALDALIAQLKKSSH